MRRFDTLSSDAGSGAGPATAAAAADAGLHVSAAICTAEYRATDSAGFYLDCTSCHLVLFQFTLHPPNFGLSVISVSGTDSGPAARSDAGSGPPSALWFSSTTTRCDYCTANSAWGAHRGTAPTGTLMPHFHNIHYDCNVKLNICVFVLFLMVAN